MHVYGMRSFGWYTTRPVGQQSVRQQPAGEQEKPSLSAQEDAVVAQLEKWNEFQLATAYWVLYRQYGMTVDRACRIRGRVLARWGG